MVNITAQRLIVKLHHTKLQCVQLANISTVGIFEFGCNTIDNTVNLNISTIYTR